VLIRKVSSAWSGPQCVQQKSGETPPDLDELGRLGVGDLDSIINCACFEFYRIRAFCFATGRKCAFPV
jgi:hypothetical protein